MILISSNYRITVSLPLCRWHPPNAPMLRKEKANAVMTRSIRHRYVFVVLVAWLCKRVLEVWCNLEGKKVKRCSVTFEQGWRAKQGFKARV